MEVAIIGAGIGGLTAALALKQAGIPFKLYEAAPGIKAVGAGIIMANNAMQVFRHLGIDSEVCQRGNLIHTITIAKPDLSPLSRISLQPFEEKYRVQNHAIHRSGLHDILSTGIGHDNIRLNKKLLLIQEKEHVYELTFEDGTTARSEYVIGADGIKSQVRRQLFSENEYRDARQICWRGVVDFKLPEQYAHEAVEIWGTAKRFGFVKLGEGSVYWYLVISSDLAKTDTEILPFAADMDPMVAAIIKATPGEMIINTPIYDLKPAHTWYKHKVCLIGDAAHATTPNLGQGACQAIVDAYVLGELVKRYPLVEAFRRYPEIRREKAHHIVNSSWKIGEVAHWRNPVAIALRNLVLKRLTPDSVNLKQLDEIFKLEAID